MISRFRTPWATVILFASLASFTACKKDKDVNLSVDNQKLDMGTSGGKSRLSISSNGNWNLNGLPDWITASATSGTGDASVELTVDTNATVAARTASLKLELTGHEGVTVTVDQKGLIGWSKELPLFDARKVISRGNEFILAGEKDNKLHFMRVSKSDGKVLSETSFTTSYFSRGWLAGIDTLANGGYVVAANIDDPADASNGNAYLVTFTPNFTAVKQTVIDYGSRMSDRADLIATIEDGIVLTVSSMDNSSYTNRLIKFDFELNRAGTEGYAVNAVNDIKVDQDGAILIAGYANSRSSVYRYDKDLNITGGYNPRVNGRAHAILPVEEGYLLVGTESESGSDQTYCMLLNRDLAPVEGKRFNLVKSGFVSASSIIALKDGGYAISGSRSLNGSSSGFSTRLHPDFTLMNNKEAVIQKSVLLSVSAASVTADGGYLLLGGSTSGITLVQVNP